MFTKLSARRPSSNVPDSSDSIPEVEVEVTEYGLPLDPAPAPAVALVIAVGLAIMPMGLFPPPPSPPPPGAAALMAVDLPGLDPLLDAADDVAGIIIPEPIVVEQENGHYHHHLQHQQQQNLLPPAFPQQPHPASLPSSSLAERGRATLDSSITNSAVQAAVATTLQGRSSRRTKPSPSCTSRGLPKIDNININNGSYDSHTAQPQQPQENKKRQQHQQPPFSSSSTTAVTSASGQTANGRYTLGVVIVQLEKMTAYRQMNTVAHRPPSQEALVPSIMSYAMPAVEVAQVLANLVINPLPPPLPVDPLPAPAPVQVPVELMFFHLGAQDVVAPLNHPQEQGPPLDNEDQ
ncbi:hypothetical protein BGZ90_008261 [Linnemannia elongata]|nr:hypothetical protein BGZ90_008261 [Linnemannia elongata]